MELETDTERGIPINKLFFSILIPVYNVEKYLTKCIESVIEQTYPYLEIILIDDGSTDGSGSICNIYAKSDKRIKVFHQHNQGLITARRNGIAKARGDYFLFLDSDDYWDKDLLETVNKAIYDYDCDMVIFNYKNITTDKTYYNKPVFENGTIFDNENKKQIFEEVIKSSRLNHIWIKAVKQNIVDYRDYTEYKKVKFAEDLLQSLPLLYNATRILYLDKAMYNYRMNPASMTHNFYLNKISDITIVRGVVLKYMELLNLKDNEALKHFYDFFIYGALFYISDLSTSNIDKSVKKELMDDIQNIDLYKNGLNYINVNDFSMEQRLRFYLFAKKYYGLLTTYENVLRFIKLHL